MAKKSLNDALKRASEDHEFALKLLKNPKQFEDEYELSEEQMSNISAAGHAAIKAAGGPTTEYFDTKQPEKPSQS